MPTLDSLKRIAHPPKVHGHIAPEELRKDARLGFVTVAGAVKHAAERPWIRWAHVRAGKVAATIARIAERTLECAAAITI